jgi:hypothetical protein
MLEYRKPNIWAVATSLIDYEYSYELATSLIDYEYNSYELATLKSRHVIE